jgi:hypothetical protein
MLESGTPNVIRSSRVSSGYFWRERVRKGEGQIVDLIDCFRVEILELLQDREASDVCRQKPHSWGISCISSLQLLAQTHTILFRHVATNDIDSIVNGFSSRLYKASGVPVGCDRRSLGENQTRIVSGNGLTTPSFHDMRPQSFAPLRF